MHPLLHRAHAVIFDFDGVLVDSEPLHEAAIKQTAADVGWTMTADHFHQMVGKGDEHAFELLAAAHNTIISSDQTADLCARKHRACIDLIHQRRFTVHSGVPSLVTRVAADRPVGICSGSRRDVVLGMLHTTEFGGLMRTVVTHEDVTLPKPAPEGYLLAASRLGVDPRRCVVIEDSPTGIRAARGAGMTVLAVCHSFPAERLHEAHAIFNRIGDLLPA